RKPSAWGDWRMKKHVAFYAPMKSPDHPNPSGDRRIARLLMKAFRRGGWDVALASRLRAHQRAGNAVGQDYLFQEANRIADSLVRSYQDDPPGVWFTYHCYYKAPDLIGPVVAHELGIPYVVAEGYRAKKRLEGPYQRFAAASARALDQAKIIFYLAERGLDALKRDAPEGQQLIHLPPFTALGDDPAPKSPTGPLKLLTVAMMRPGDKLDSYRVLAEALKGLTSDWTLNVVGDGEAAGEVRALLASFGERINYAGLIEGQRPMREAYEAADLFVWPGVNEAFGMVYLEAQAAGTPCVAQDREGVREVVGETGRLSDPDDPGAMASAIEELAADRAKLAALVTPTRDYVRSRHGINAASSLITTSLEGLA
ncbi:MAG: glycosyltransferase family 4 protein, partial [Pseudomonadota bacterium]